MLTDFLLLRLFPSLEFSFDLKSFFDDLWGDAPSFDSFKIEFRGFGSSVRDNEFCENARGLSCAIGGDSES